MRFRLLRLCVLLSLAAPFAGLAAGAPAPAARAPGPLTPGSPHRFGRFDLDESLAQLAKHPEFAPCASLLSTPSGHAECDVGPEGDHVARVQLAWEVGRDPGGDLVALRLSFDPATAPALTDLEWQLSQKWGAPALEQLRRDKGHKFFTLEWEDAGHRAIVEASAPISQPSRVVAIILERRPPALSGDLAGLKPRPFPGFHLRWVRRLDFDGNPFAVVYGSSLSPAQEALGEAGPAWLTQRTYVGIWRLDQASGEHKRRWRMGWDRITGGDDDEDPQRVLRIDTHDVTGDGAPDVLVEFTCDSCARTANEVILKTVRAGKLVDLFAKRDLFRATVELDPGRIRIREPEDHEDGSSSSTLSTYAYDRSKGAFFLAREEHLEN